MWSRVQVEGEEAVAVVRRGAGQIVGMVLMAIIIIFALTILYYRVLWGIHEVGEWEALRVRIAREDLSLYVVGGSAVIESRWNGLSRVVGVAALLSNGTIVVAELEPPLVVEPYTVVSLNLSSLRWVALSGSKPVEYPSSGRPIHNVGEVLRNATKVCVVTEWGHLFCNVSPIVVYVNASTSNASELLSGVGVSAATSPLQVYAPGGVVSLEVNASSSRDRSGVGGEMSLHPSAIPIAVVELDPIHDPYSAAAGLQIHVIEVSYSYSPGTISGLRVSVDGGPPSSCLVIEGGRVYPCRPNWAYPASSYLVVDGVPLKLVGADLGEPLRFYVELLYAYAVSDSAIGRAVAVVVEDYSGLVRRAPWYVSISGFSPYVAEVWYSLGSDGRFHTTVGGHDVALTLVEAPKPLNASASPSPSGREVEWVVMGYGPPPGSWSLYLDLIDTRSQVEWWGLHSESVALLRLGRGVYAAIVLAPPIGWVYEWSYGITYWEATWYRSYELAWGGGLPLDIVRPSATPETSYVSVEPFWSRPAPLMNLSFI